MQAGRNFGARGAGSRAQGAANLEFGEMNPLYIPCMAHPL